jgi:uncharacterized protein (TIGR03437 family)
MSPGEVISITGQQLAVQAADIAGGTLPTQLSGTQVLIGGKPIPLRSVSAGQITAQVPFDVGIDPQQQLIVQRGNTQSVPQSVVVAASHPAVYTQDGLGVLGNGIGEIVNGATNMLITPSHPAQAGDVIIMYCDGLGAVTPSIPPGTPAPASPPVPVNPVTVQIDRADAQVLYAGLAPNYVGLYQVKAVVPDKVFNGIRTGGTLQASNIARTQVSVEVTVKVAGQTSPPVTMPVRKKPGRPAGTPGIR